MTTTFWLVAFILNAHTGQELSRHLVSGPYDTIPACSLAQQTTVPRVQRPIPTPQGLVITLYECVAASPGPEKSQ